MIYADASEAARVCLAASNRGGLVDPELHRYFSAELGDLIPEGSILGVAEGGEGPLVIAVGESDLLVARALVAEEGKLQLASSIVPLWPIPQLELVSEISADRRSRHRRWTLRSAHGDPLQIETAEVFHSDAGGDTGPDSGEMVMRALVERLSVAAERR